MFSFEISKPIVVIGDVMLDHYYYGPVDRISPEAPVPVVGVKDSYRRVGGAGNVAFNIAHLGQPVALIGLCGHDESADWIYKTCQRAHIDCHLIRVENKPTIRKCRVISQGQQLLRMDFETIFDQEDAALLVEPFKKALDHASAVLISDYGKGSLYQVEVLIALAKQKGLPILVDPKGNDFSKYRGATLIKPNKSEFQNIVGPSDSPTMFESKAVHLCRQLDLKALVISLGSDGISLFDQHKRVEHFSSIAQEVVDVTGAGDTVIATMAVAIASGYDYSIAMYAANLAAGIVVQRIGTSTVTQQELQRAAKNDDSTPHGIMTRETLLPLVEHLKHEGKTIVMTNGCFDLMHSGHVAYLEKAKAEGDILIVAVNDDDSIMRIKGKSRPIAPLESRMMVLAALRAVDFVIPFHEDTPKFLLELLKPDILVKGTDYTLDQIVGAEIVLAYGGKVKQVTHPYKAITTSSLIKRAKESDVS